MKQKYFNILLPILIWTISVYPPNAINKAEQKPQDPFMEGHSLKKSDGTTFHFDDVKGKVLLLDFWATWCGPCIKQHPKVEKLNEEIKDANFELITLSIDRDFNAWQRFFEKNKWSGHNIHLGWTPDHPLFQMVSQKIDLGNGENTISAGVPRYFLVDKTGKPTEIEDFNIKKVKAKIGALLED